MKVDCIVGRDRDMADNLQYRQQFYEGIKSSGNTRLDLNNFMPYFCFMEFWLISLPDLLDY